MSTPRIARLFTAMTISGILALALAIPARAGFTIYQPDPTAVAACWKYVGAYGGVYQVTSLLINTTGSAQSGRVQVTRPGVGTTEDTSFTAAPGEWKFAPTANVAVVPNDVFNFYLNGALAVGIPANGFNVYMGRCEGDRRETILARAHEWYQKSNGWVSGVAAFGRDPNRYFDGVNPPVGSSSAGYRTDCSGMTAWAWGTPAPGAQSSSFGPAYGNAINVADLQPGDVLGTTDPGHITLFDRWVDQAAWTYLAYDFGGGGAGNTGNADGQMEYKQYQLHSVSGQYAYRYGDPRQYMAWGVR